MLEKYDGNYYIAFEQSITDNNIDIQCIEHLYRLDANRRIFDKNWLPNEKGQILDSRINSGLQTTSILNSKDILTTENIPVKPVI